MTLYFCINDIFDQLDRLPAGVKKLKQLVNISTSQPDCGGHNQDAFMVTDDLNILDFTTASAAYSLSELTNDIPLYRINIELTLDLALRNQNKNASLQKALEKAFAPQSLPRSFHDESELKNDLSEYTSTGLHHPMVGYLDSLELCQIYIKFLNNFETIPDEYRFEKAILGKQSNRFTEYYEGFCTHYHGQLQAEALLRHSRRIDHDPDKNQQSAVESGTKKAAMMNIADPFESIWVWLEADDYQQRRCTDIDRFLQNYPLKTYPIWLRTEMFCLLEKETIKKYLASALKNNQSDLGFLDAAPALQKAITNNAAGNLDETLRDLINTILKMEEAYNNQAGTFATEAEKRKNEALRLDIQTASLKA